MIVGEILFVALIAFGSFFTLVGSIGLVRLPDYYQRLHGPTKATTLGVGSFLVASLVYFGFRGEGLRLHMLLITLFLFITSPVVGHLLARTGLTLQIPTSTRRPSRTYGHLGDGDAPAARQAEYRSGEVE
jgi:multicomponent K+:H+ antiporter subunit G